MHDWVCHWLSRISLTYYSGNLYRHGDSPAEANHSSYVIRIGKQSAVEPAEAIKHMIGRQIDIIKERLAKVAKHVLTVLATEQLLSNEEDKLALRWLCMEGFALWSKTSSWTKYKVTLSTNDPNQMQVSFPDSDKAPYLIGTTCFEGTTVISESGRCSCQDRTAYLHQCRHERAVLKGRFASHLWQKRWKRRLSIIMSDGNPAIACEEAEYSVVTPIDLGASKIGTCVQNVNGAISVIGKPKEADEWGQMFPDVDDNMSDSLDRGTEEMFQQAVAPTCLQPSHLEKVKLTQNLTFKRQMMILSNLATAYRGHTDELEFYRACLAQTSKLKGVVDSTASPIDYLLNYIGGYTSCRSNDVLFSQMELSQTELNDGALPNKTAPTSFPLAPGLVPYGALATSATGAPQRKCLKSHREMTVHCPMKLHRLHSH
jgi:hypothetical protein